MVAALGDLQVGVVFRRQLDAGLGDQIRKRIMRFGKMMVDMPHHLLRRMRPGNRKHLGMDARDHIAAIGVAAGPQTAGDDDFAVLGKCLANRIERFCDRVIYEATGIDDHQVGVLVARRNLVSLGPQLRNDQFAIDQRLWAAKRNETNLGLR